MRFALIHNSRSRRNKSSGSGFAAAAESLLGENFIPSDSREGTTDRLRVLREKGVKTIAIDGGDGTVSTALTAIARVYPAHELPDIAVLASGNTNLIAQDVGFGLRGFQALRRLRQGAMRSSLRTPVQLIWPESDRLPVMGLFGGCAGYARAVRIAHAPQIVRFAPHDLAVGVTVLGAIGSLIFRRSRERWLAGDPLKITTQERSYGGESFMFLVTGLSQLSRGIWPFWDTDPCDTGVRYLDVSAHPASLGRAAIALLTGRAPRWLRRHPDYDSGRTDRMMLTTTSDFVLDGEVFSPTPSQQLIVQSGPAFRFLHA